MAKKQKILIIDDDPTVSGALSAFFSRLGFEPIVEIKSDKVISLLRIDTFFGVIIDCMIPGINGVDLAKKIRTEVNFKKKIILISGIFTDPKFAEASKEKSGANDFLFKPVNLDKLETHFQRAEATQVTLPWLPKLFVQALDHEVINEELFLQSEIKSEEILILFSALKKAALTTELLISSDKNKYRLKFTSGELTCMIFSNSDSLVKKYVLERNFCRESDIDRLQFNALNYAEVFVESVLLSPHLAETMVQDIDFMIFQKLIGDKVTYRLSLLEESGIPNRKITINQYDNMMAEYCFKGVSSIFLVDYFSSFKDLSVCVKKGFDKTFKFNPIIKPYLEIIDGMRTPIVFRELVKSYNKAKVIRLVYFLNVSGNLVLSMSAVKERDFEELITMFSTMLGQIRDLEPDEVFSFFGINPNQISEVNKFFKAFAVKYHPDKIPAGAPSSLEDMSRELFSMVADAHSVVSDPDKRTEYKKANRSKRAESALKAEALKEEGQAFIKRGKFSEALPFFERSREIHSDNMVTLYYYWCLLKAKKDVSGKVEIQKVYDELNNLGEEEKNNELFVLVYGLLLKNDRKFSQAKNAFKQAIEYNSNFLPARRELLQIQAHLKKATKSETSLLNADIGAVVASFFKKKVNKK